MLRRMMTLVPVLLTLAGCQSIPAQPGFDAVQADVDARIGHRVSWRTGAEEDRQADDAVRKLLAAELTSASAQQIALLNNRRLQAAYEELGIAQAGVVQAGLLRNPVFDVSVMFPAGGGSPKLDFGVAQDFLDVLLIPMRSRIAATRFEAAKMQITAQVLDLAHATHLAFLQVQADEQTLAQRSQNLEAAAASYEFAQKLRKAGNIRNVDLAGEQAALAQAKLDVATAQAVLEDHREQLTGLMGLWGEDTQWRIAAKLPDLPGDFGDLADLEKRAIAASLDLAIVNHRLNGLAQELGLTRSTSLVGEFELGVNAERDGGHWESGPSIAVPIPLFDQGQARVATARSQMRREEHQLYATAVAVRSAARRARLRLVTAQETAIYYRDEIMPLRATIMKETMLQYNAMQVSVFQLLTARSQQIDANRRYLEAVHEYWRAKAQLDLLLAGRMSESDLSTSSDATAAPTPATGDRGGH